MQYDFLKQFSNRMKHVGRYSILMQNSMQKSTWKQYGILKIDEQMNFIFAVMLYIMEQSLREDTCTTDDIAAFIDTVNMQYFEKNLSYDDCKNLGEFILNVVLSNEGKAMYFDGYDFEQKAYKIMHISFIANKIIYVDSEIRRTSYYLTDDGYNLLLSTLEIENNMKLTIHEMIFKMHLEKQSYDKAVDEIKNVFNLLHIQLQKIQEAMGKIRRNALNYSVVDYENLQDENIETIRDTKRKFQNYRDHVKARVQELEEANINVKKLDEKEEEKLSNLREIERYLSWAIDEHQEILNSHFDLKALYTKELEALAQMAVIQRFSLRSELYDKVLEDAGLLERLEYFLRPLFCQDAEKVYNLNKALEIQRPVRKREEEDTEEVLDFDEAAWEEELERQRTEKLKKYEKSLGTILDLAMEQGEITLKEIQEQIKERNELFSLIIPNVEIFKEIMVELIRNKEIDVAALRKERSEFLGETSGDFQLSETILNLLDERQREIRRIEVYRVPDGNAVVFDNVVDEDGNRKRIRCSNVLIRMVEKES